VFVDERMHALCAEPARARAFWGASWNALVVCLGLLIDSLDFGHLRKWQALDIQLASGRVHVTHREAVVSLVPVAPDGTAMEIHEGIAVKNLDRVVAAQVVDVVCGGKAATDRRGRS
jgi:hypothetical protein